MAAIDHFNLRSFDLNLLVAFDALMQERSVTLAAKRLRIQQPAMSHSLSTLRVILDDELLVRVKNSMEPTDRALELYEPIRELLAQAQHVLRTSKTFDPSIDERVFRIGLTDGLEVLLLPELISGLRRSAPSVSLAARTIEPLGAADLLDAGELDLIIGCYNSPASWQHSEPLFKETLSCCFNPQLLGFEVPISKHCYIETPQAVVSLNGELWGCLRPALEEIDATINIVASGPNFLATLMMAREAPLLTTLPSRIAGLYAPIFGLRTSAVPLPFSATSISMVWPGRADREPGSVWLRGQIRGCQVVQRGLRDSVSTMAAE
ncbi:LysR family transcriptional regulator [Bradyrhizobium barranii subsp. apii]|uniref:LysR family transcriptional regulator n=1 Tax=Bradyrhizobium barranii subsp. apii TaxID=2819348 RepID=A0A8T5UWZ7_9BRAD|nr:LysR family transcriptional regulator [Bradyrhizobium barranii]UPT86969.1 LysR family transcriptional regulator [Bradyrhizobium barranii subsp. apii]